MRSMSKAGLAFNQIKMIKMKIKLKIRMQKTIIFFKNKFKIWIRKQVFRFFFNPKLEFSRRFQSSLKRR